MKVIKYILTIILCGIFVFYTSCRTEKQPDRQQPPVKKQKKEIRMNSNVITRNQIQQMSASSIYDILRSSVPGVTVTEGGKGSIVTIRGTNSLESNIEPLFIIDGSEYESSADANAQVSINDIEKIEIDKDGSAYGVRGANGVIIITTR